MLESVKIREVLFKKNLFIGVITGIIIGIILSIAFWNSIENCLLEITNKINRIHSLLEARILVGFIFLIPMALLFVTHKEGVTIFLYLGNKLDNKLKSRKIKNPFFRR